MNKQDFINLVKDPSHITPEQMQELEKIVAGFPYCQSAHILIAKYSSDAGTMLADQKLKKAAAYTLDRKNLKNLLHKSSSEKIIREVLPIAEPVLNKVEESQPQIFPEEKLVSEKKEEKNTVERAIVSHDDILTELQKNLEQLSKLKNLASLEKEEKEKLKAQFQEEKILEEIKPETKPEKKEEESIKAIVQTESASELIVEKPAVEVIQEKVTDTIQEPEIVVPTEKIFPPFTENILEPAYIHPVIDPVRTEDVVMENTEASDDSDLLLDYLSYLDSERSQYKRNKKKEEEIIDKFIKEDPSIPKLNSADLPEEVEDLSARSTTVNKGLVSENYAKILVLQGKREKAIDIYNELILKNPEKRTYFEAQIEKLKK